MRQVDAGALCALGKFKRSCMCKQTSHFRLLHHHFPPCKLQLKGFHIINIKMSHTAPVPASNGFTALLNAVCSVFQPSARSRNTMLDHFGLLSANMPGFFPPWKKMISFPSDSCQIKQIYSLALKNFWVCQESGSSRPQSAVSGAALWQLKWDENYSGFWERKMARRTFSCKLSHFETNLRHD